MGREELLLTGIGILLISAVPAGPAFAGETAPPEVPTTWGAGKNEVIGRASGGGANPISDPDVEAPTSSNESVQESPSFWIGSDELVEQYPCVVSVEWNSFTCQPEEAAAEEGAAAVTLSDVERFKPARPGALSQPDGWGLVDRPVNFVIDVEPHIVQGTLLDRPADVRFTPVAFRIETSDGGVVESDDLGATWEELGVEDFTETATSHVFTERGTHTFTPTVLYTAEYRFGGSGWTPIPGGLGIEGEPQEILIGKIETVLIPNPS